MAENLKVADVIPAVPRAVYEAWLDPKKHALMTGAATSDEGDGAFTAWDGYISGRTLSASPFKKIVQSWRTSHFAANAPDSVVTVELEPFDGGTQRARYLYAGGRRSEAGGDPGPERPAGKRLPLHAVRFARCQPHRDRGGTGPLGSERTRWPCRSSGGLAGQPGADRL